MSFHKSELRITVVDDLEWPALQEYSDTPHSLFPRDVTLDGEDALSVSRLTPNSASGKFAWPDSKTPTTSHTFGFPLSPVSAVSRISPKCQSPFEKHKRRLVRYNAAESRLAQLPNPSTLSPSQLRAEAINYATCSVAAQVSDARLSLRGIRVSGRRDGARWMAEHRLAALESLQTELEKSWARGKDDEGDSLRRRESNLVRFLGVRRDEGLVPVFTRTRGRRPNHGQATTEDDRRCMTVGSPMKLQSDAMPAPPTARSEWPWETRVRAVLLHPAPKLPTPPLRVLTEPSTSPAPLSTPTSGSYSPIEPETPLTEPEDDNDEDEYEDYPIFALDSVRSYNQWQPRRPLPSSSKLLPAAKPPPTGPLPPLATNLSPDASYAWLADPSTWTSSSGWHGDGWEISPASASSSSSTASPTALSPSVSLAASAPLPSAPTRPQTLPTPPTHRFWARERHRRIPSLRPIAEATRDAAYAVRPLPKPPSASRPLPALPPPAPSAASSTPQKKSRHFFSGLVRRMNVEREPESPEEAVRETDREQERERERNKLRKRGSIRSLPSTNALSLGLRDSAL
ncbi:hypothetical protein B0H11DRAFT_2260594 [Mycena galericulata]|nr:hypothetical protein B0H11DRAFT_2260594 [Mycena galericulata]